MKYVLFIFFFFVFVLIRSQEIKLADQLTGHGFENVSVVDADNVLYITYENNLFRFEAKALAFILNDKFIFDISKYKEVYFLLRSQDIPMAIANISSNVLMDYWNGIIDVRMLVSAFNFDLETDDIEMVFKSSSVHNSSYFKIDIPVSLSVDYLLGDFRDGFQSRIYVSPKVFTVLGQGTQFEFKFRNIVQNDIPGSAISSPEILKLSQSFRFSNNAFLSLDFGYLPQNKFGFHSRFRNYVVKEKFFIELFYASTRQGYLDNNWNVQNNRNSDASWQTALNYRWNKFDTDFNLTYGTFLSGDLGYKFQLSRQFNEFFLNLFYARTDVESQGSFGSIERGIIGFSLELPFGQSKFMKPNRFRLRTDDSFNLLYRYSGLSFSSIDIIQGNNIFTEIREFYPEILRKGLLKYLHN
jgi:hypothetical protein